MLASNWNIENIHALLLKFDIESAKLSLLCITFAVAVALVLYEYVLNFSSSVWQCQYFEF